MSVGLLANQSSLTERGVVPLKQCFGRFDDDLLGPDEDLHFFLKKTPWSSPKFSSALELNLVYYESTKKSFISMQILRHPPCADDSGHQGSSNTVNICIAMLAICSILSV